MNIEKIIKSIVAEILPLINKRLLLFISGGTVNVEILLDTLSDSELISYDIVMTDAAKKLLDETSIKKLKGNIIDRIDKLDSAINHASFILIPIMTKNTLSKAALGIADNLVTTGIARALMMNKEIIAVRDSYAPENPINISNGLSKNSLYNAMFLKYEETLSSFGVKIIDAKEFKGTIQNQFNKSLPQPLEKEKATVKNKHFFESSIVTLTDLKGIENDCGIVIQKGTIITPLARDYIYSNKINVTYGE
ncbi:flavoprotein [Clostridium formicaceticum]|uniref:Bifunctional phosphopantothenoylcysteine decarboxylase/phosphopantothenate synthase n=1 Tax=Clostridium formicaceticum TaxID=1497 RepID=A0AAC9RKC3_9CLOT|nr:flavoprotein [Clostridium formicaceticum]AOY77126.1 hypothetical protein BJL90_15490 [Clostridium formicaceticum]ARE87641.1 bifunctional phosphopantothenoylcysteine decarboxylase/phosphopantothenate synthase [Clostridium formicaceticum]